MNNLVNKPIPKAGPNNAIIRAMHALVSTSDVHTVKAAMGDRKGPTPGHSSFLSRNELQTLLHDYLSREYVLNRMNCNFIRARAVFRLIRGLV